MVIVLIIVGLIVLVGVIYILMRNSIIASRNRVDEAWSGIDVQLKRRHDLVPNLVESVKGYASHEQRTFENVTKARSQAMAAEGVQDTAKAESALGAALGQLRVVAEQYPDLRATENFQQLQRQLSELEDEIQASRRIYNSNVQSYNTKIQQFPMSIVANQGGFEDREFFEIEEPSDREVPQVSFGQTPPAETPPAGQTPPPAAG
jgi:LemA protein